MKNNKTTAILCIIFAYLTFQAIMSGNCVLIAGALLSSIFGIFLNLQNKKQ